MKRFLLMVIQFGLAAWIAGAFLTDNPEAPTGHGLVIGVGLVYAGFWCFNRARDLLLHFVRKQRGRIEQTGTGQDAWLRDDTGDAGASVQRRIPR